MSSVHERAMWSSMMAGARQAGVLCMDRRHSQPESVPASVRFIRAVEDAMGMCIHTGWLSPRFQGRLLSRVSVWGKRYAKVLKTADPRVLSLLLFESPEALKPSAHLHIDLGVATFDECSGLSRKAHRFSVQARLSDDIYAPAHRFEFAVASRSELQAWRLVFEVRGQSFDFGVGRDSARKHLLESFSKRRAPVLDNEQDELLASPSSTHSSWSSTDSTEIVAASTLSARYQNQVNVDADADAKPAPASRLASRVRMWSAHVLVASG